MDEAILRLGWKKLAIILFVFAVLLLIPIILSLFPIKSPIQNSRIPVVSPTPITNPRAREDWKRHENRLFQIDYPSSWWINLPQTKEGIALFMQQSGESGDLFPRIDIHAWFDAKKDRLDKTAEIITSLNFQRSNTSFFGRNVIRFEEDLALNTSEKARRVVKKIIYLFEEKGFVYEIDYGYYKDDISGEKVIRDILSTFRLK